MICLQPYIAVDAGIDRTQGNSNNKIKQCKLKLELILIFIIYYIFHMAGITFWNIIFIACETLTWYIWELFILWIHCNPQKKLYFFYFLGPNGNESKQPVYPGFERDVLKTVGDYFQRLKEPLLTFHLYEVFVNILSECYRIWVYYWHRE